MASSSGHHTPLIISDDSGGNSPREAVEFGSSGSRREMRVSIPIVHRLSGRWKFKYQKFVADDVFGETDLLSEGKREYYKQQRETLAAFQQVDAISSSGRVSESLSSETREVDSKVDFAILASNVTNLLLLFVKIYSSVQSRSLAIVASTLDSLLDLLAGAVLWFAHMTMRSNNQYKYPIGKLRVQPVGIVVFAATMATLGVQVLVVAVQHLAEGDKSSKMNETERNWLTLIMGSASAVKLFLFFYCRSFESSIVQAFAQDHLFDVLTNSVGLAAALLADKYAWWIDPCGALLLALYTIINWSKTVLENAASLIGQAAPPMMLQKLTYMAYNHSDKIVHIDTVRAYTFGSLYFVEVHIELPEDMQLREAHNIGETLQNKLEALPEVERAFVHLDFESFHRPEHNETEKVNRSRYRWERISRQ